MLQANRISRLLGLIWMAGLVPQAHGAFGFNFDGTLDKKAISRAYFEGDFARVLPPLEMYRQVFPDNATREDSIFVYKYLSVIYAADSTTRQKAESFMVQLLKLMPTIELIDLYISDNIQAIFRNVRADFLKQQQYVREHDQYGQRRPGTSRDSSASPGKSRRAPSGDTAATRSGQFRPAGAWKWWAAGGLAVSAAAVGIYYLVTEPEPGNSYVLQE